MAIMAREMTLALAEATIKIMEVEGMEAGVNFVGKSHQGSGAENTYERAAAHAHP